VVEHDQTVHARMVESRCAIAITVSSVMGAPRLSWIAASISQSSAEVASSSTRIGAFFRDHARDRDALAARELYTALANLCFGPPVRMKLRKPTAVRSDFAADLRLRSD
jgi:hypothetical protein